MVFGEKQMKKILANMSYILVTSRKHTGAIFAIIGFIGLFAPLTIVPVCKRG